VRAASSLPSNEATPAAQSAIDEIGAAMRAAAREVQPATATLV